MARAFLQNDVRWDGWDYLAFVLSPFGCVVFAVILVVDRLHG